MIKLNNLNLTDDETRAVQDLLDWAEPESHQHAMLTKVKTVSIQESVDATLPPVPDYTGSNATYSLKDMRWAIAVSATAGSLIGILVGALIYLNAAVTCQ